MTVELPRLSFSALDEYTTCAYRYYLHRVQQKADAPSWHSIGGTAFHDLTERYELGKVRGDPAGDWQQLYATAFDAATEQQLQHYSVDDIVTFGKLGRDAWRTEHGPALMQRWHTWLLQQTDLQIATDLPPDESGNTVGVEYRFDVDIDGVGVRGFIDRIYTHPQWGVGVVDLKTGVLHKNGQLQDYRTALGILGVHTDWQALYSAKNGELKHFRQCLTQPAEMLLPLYRQAGHMIASGLYLPNRGDHCFSCPMGQHCAVRP